MPADPETRQRRPWRRRAASADSPPAAGSSRRTRRAARDPHWDNVRLLSGTLVLIGHLIEPLGHIDGLRWLHVTSWAMRVPVFVIVAGYFSSAGPLSVRELRRLTESVLAPYLLIGLLHTLQMAYFHGEWKFFTSDPAWGLWFLLSLFVWRMLLPYLAVLRAPLLTSLGAALVVGYISSFGPAFSASRTVAFLPFFVLGWQLRQPWADGLFRARWTRHTALAVLAVTAVCGWLFRHRIDNAWLAMNAPYEESVAFATAWAWGLRGTVLVCGMVIALSFIRLVPKRQLPVVTYLGAGGLYIYLLHPLVLRALTLHWDITRIGPWPEQLGLLAVGVALAASLASPPVRKVTRPLVQPRLPWLYATPGPPAQGEPAGEPAGGPAGEPAGEPTGEPATGGREPGSRAALPRR